MITVAPRRRNHAASGTHALRVGSMMTITSSASAGSRAHSASRSSALVRNRWPDHTIRPVSSAHAARCAARQATSIPSLIFTWLLLDRQHGSHDDEGLRQTFTIRDRHDRDVAKFLTGTAPRTAWTPPDATINRQGVHRSGSNRSHSDAGQAPDPSNLRDRPDHDTPTRAATDYECH